MPPLKHYNTLFDDTEVHALFVTEMKCADDEVEKRVVALMFDIDYDTIDFEDVDNFMYDWDV